MALFIKESNSVRPESQHDDLDDEENFVECDDDRDDEEDFVEYDDH